MVLTPIEVAIEDVQKKICELDAAITQVMKDFFWDLIMLIFGNLTSLKN